MYYSLTIHTNVPLYLHKYNWNYKQTLEKKYNHTRLQIALEFPSPSHFLTVGQTEANKGQRFNEYVPVCAAIANRISHSAGHITEHINEPPVPHQPHTTNESLICSFPTSPAERTKDKWILNNLAAAMDWADVKQPATDSIPILLLCIRE